MPDILDLVAILAALIGGCGLVLLCLAQLRRSGDIYPPGRLQTPGRIQTPGPVDEMVKLANKRARAVRIRDIKDRLAKIAVRTRKGGGRNASD